MYDRNNGAGPIQMKKWKDTIFLGLKENLISQEAIDYLTKTFEENKVYVEKNWNLTKVWDYEPDKNIDDQVILMTIDKIVEAGESVIGQKLKWHAFKIVDYVEGSECYPHWDNPEASYLSCILMLDLSEDLEGGDPFFWRAKEQYIYPKPLKSGDLLMYSQNLIHGVDKVQRGRRLVAICWLLQEGQ